MYIFWRHGFQGTSLTVLTEAMGISRPTLYAAFGDKVTLFREAVLAYSARTAADYAAVLNLPTAREVAEGWLRLAGHVSPTPGAPPGCIILQGVFVGSADTVELRAELSALRRFGTDELARRFHRAFIEGDLQPGTNPDQLAEYLTAVAVGMTVGSVDGVTPDRLNGVVRAAMANWPPCA